MMTLLLLLAGGLQDSAKTTYDHAASFSMQTTSREVTASEECRLTARGCRSVLAIETKSASGVKHGTVTLESSWEAGKGVLSVTWTSDLKHTSRGNSTSVVEKCVYVIGEKEITWTRTFNDKPSKGRMDAVGPIDIAVGRADVDMAGSWAALMQREDVRALVPGGELTIRMMRIDGGRPDQWSEVLRCVRVSGDGKSRFYESGSKVAGKFMDTFEVDAATGRLITMTSVAEGPKVACKATAKLKADK